MPPIRVRRRGVLGQPDLARRQTFELKNAKQLLLTLTICSVARAVGAMIVRVMF